MRAASRLTVLTSWRAIAGLWPATSTNVPRSITPSLVSVSARAVTRFWPVAKAEEIQNVSPGRSNTIMTCSRPSTLDR